MPTVVVYKWVKDHGDGLLRSLTLPPEDPLSVVYRPGQWVEAPVGGLFVFSSLSYAEEMLYGMQNKYMLMWRCHALSEEEVRIPRLGSGGFPYVMIQPTFEGAPKYWSGRRWGAGLFDLAPWGSKAYRRILLIEPVSRPYLAEYLTAPIYDLLPKWLLDEVARTLRVSSWQLIGSRVEAIQKKLVDAGWPELANIFRSWVFEAAEERREQARKDQAGR